MTASATGLIVKFTANSASVDQAFQKLNNSTVALTNRMLGIGTALITGLAPIAAFRTLSRIGDDIDAITDKARGLGVAASTFQSLAYAASLSGVGVDDLSTAISKMNLSLAQVATGEKKIPGLDLSGLSGDSGQKFQQLAAQIANVKDPILQVNLAFQLFGRGYKEVLNLIRDGSLKEGTEDFKKMGLAISDAQRQGVDKFGDSQTRLNAIVSAFGQKVTAAAAGPLANFITALGDVITQFGGLDTVASKVAEGIVSSFTVMLHGIQGLLVGLGAVAVGFDRLKQGASFIQLGGEYVANAASEVVGAIQNGDSPSKALERIQKDNTGSLDRFVGEGKGKLDTTNQDSVFAVIAANDRLIDSLHQAGQSFIQPISNMNKFNDALDLSTLSLKAITDALNAQRDATVKSIIDTAVNDPRAPKQYVDSRFQALFNDIVRTPGNANRSAYQAIGDNASGGKTELQELENIVKQSAQFSDVSITGMQQALKELQGFLSGQAAPKPAEVNLNITVEPTPDFYVKTTQKTVASPAFTKKVGQTTADFIADYARQTGQRGR